MTQQVPTRSTSPVPDPDGTGTIDPVNQAIFNKEIRQFVKDKAAITAAMKALYNMVWGQRSEALCSKLKSNPDYNTISANADSLGLLRAIRSEMTGFKRLHYLAHSVHSIMREFYSLAQGKHRTNQEYYNEFNNLVAAVDKCGAMVGKHPTINNKIIQEMAANAQNPTNDEHMNAKHTSKEEWYLAVAFLLGAN